MKKLLFTTAILFSVLTGFAQKTDELNSKVSDSKVIPPSIIDKVSGDYYDYTKTEKPERPYMHAYDKTLTMKMYLASKGNDRSYVQITFEQALQKIIQADNLTRGIPKIVYLVGWQYFGHDDKYPAWFEVNKALKRPQDKTALESFLWLKNEAQKYNTTISVHINMTDALTDSPLWDKYYNNGYIIRDANGPIDVSGTPGYHSYRIIYTREWADGYAQQRIDSIINMLQLQSAGTVHLDAFFPYSCEYYGTTQVQETQTMRKIFRYWRDKGIDVTSEQQARNRPDPFIGLQPMAWWFDLTREQQTTIHQQLACGGMPFEPNDSITGFLFGQSMHGEDIFGLDNFIPEFKKQFCTTTLQMVYQNTRQFMSYDSIANTTTYTGGLVINAKDVTVKENGRLLRTGNDVFIPAAWKSNKEIIAFSEKGYTAKEWNLPPEWLCVKAVETYSITDKGLIRKAKLPVRNGKITLSLGAMEEVLVQPVR